MWSLILSFFSVSNGSNIAKYLKHGVCIIFILTAFLSGYGLATREGYHKALQREYELMSQQADALLNLHKTTKQRYEEIINATKKLNEDKHSIDDKYNELVSNRLSKLNQSTDNNTMSNTTNTTCRLSENDRVNARADRQRFQRLYERTMSYARECDVDRARLNSLIDLYNSLQITN